MEDGGFQDEPDNTSLQQIVSYSEHTLHRIKDDVYEHLKDQ
jgi:hypothetical protein